MTSASLAFPVGHYLGAVPGEGHRVRVGRERPQLDERDFDTWLLAHGVPADDGRPWTVGDMHDAAAVTRAELAVESLAGRGLLALVEPGAAKDFASAHRVVPLLVGFGNRADAPLEFAIGLPGLPPAVVVGPDTYQLWQWGHAAPSLWSVCEVLAGVASDTGAPAAPDDLLAVLLVGLRSLLARSAAYLDIAEMP